MWSIKKILIFLLCANFLVIKISAQNLINEFQSTYYEIKGQPWSDIIDMVKDHENFLWFSTRFGLYRFDGNEFKLYTHDPNSKFSLPSNVVTTIFVDSLDRLWVHGPTFGLVCKDKESNDFINVDFSQSNNSASNIRQILEPKRNHLLVLSQSTGLIELKNYGSGDYSRANHFSDIPFSNGYIDDDGKIWLGTWGKGLYSLLDINNIENSLKLELKTNLTIFSLKDCKKKLIIGSSQGLFIYDKETSELRNVELPYVQFSPGIKARGIIQVDKNKFWISMKYGILEFNAESEKITREITTVSNNLPEAGYSMFINFGDHRVMAGFRKGIYLFDFNNTVFKNIGIYEQNDEAVEWGAATSVLIDDGDLWYGKFTGGLILRHGGKEYSFDLAGFNGPAQKGYPQVYSIAKDSIFNRVWFGGYFGIGFIDKDTFNPEHPKFSVFTYFKNDQFKIPTYSVNTLAIGEKGTVWAGTPNGLFNIVSKEKNQFEVNNIEFTVETLNDRPTYFFTSILIDKGTIWCGTYGGL
ncbi:MAG TPA: hypothetical protein VJ945_09120, partial [Flavobacteriaceae bacterium]|nr:hypothetical protein [Flavobacteriaceae bacterium]